MLTITALPAFNDNYIWLLQDSATQCAAVDPGDAKPVLQWLKDNPGWQLTDILKSRTTTTIIRWYRHVRQATGARVHGPGESH